MWHFGRVRAYATQAAPISESDGPRSDLERAAREQAASNAPTVELFDGRSIPEKEGACDLTLFAYSLHHAADFAEALLRETARVTKADGWVLIAEDDVGTTPAEAQRNARLDAAGIFRSLAEWNAMLTRLGLEVVAAGRMFGSEQQQVYSIARRRHAPSPAASSR